MVKNNPVMKMFGKYESLLIIFYLNIHPFRSTRKHYFPTYSTYQLKIFVIVNKHLNLIRVGHI